MSNEAPGTPFPGAFVRQICIDCGKNTRAEGEQFMVWHHVWEAIGGHTCFPDCYEHGDGQANHPASLCLDCVETRLGRELQPGDFMPCPLNYGKNRSARLIDRVGG